MKVVFPGESAFFLEHKYVAMNKHINSEDRGAACTSHLRAIHDTLDLLNGKWKISILGALTFGNKRFMELQREVEGIGSKMLSKELRELELNALIKRTVYDTKPVTVEYEITDYGKTLTPIINEMANWGHKHRKKIMNQA